MPDGTVAISSVATRAPSRPPGLLSDQDARACDPITHVDLGAGYIRDMTFTTAPWHTRRRGMDSAHRASYFMQSAPRQYTDDQARQMVEEVISG